MRLESGLVFRVAPRFHCVAAWPERLRVNGGMLCGASAVRPRDDWHAADEAELCVLVDDGAAAPAASDRCLQLLSIPAHLRGRWWELAEHDAASAGAMSGYDALVEDLLALLRFKRLPVPERCRADVVISRAGQASIRLDVGGKALAGLGFGSVGVHDAGAVPVGVINLGDETSCVVVLNLAGSALRERCGVESTRDGAALLSTFARRCADYPLVGVRLAPGEGLWLPTPPPAFDGWTVGKQDLDAMLVLHAL